MRSGGADQQGAPTTPCLCTGSLMHSTPMPSNNGSKMCGWHWPHLDRMDAHSCPRRATLAGTACMKLLQMLHVFQLHGCKIRHTCAWCAARLLPQSAVHRGLHSRQSYASWAVQQAGRIRRHLRNQQTLLPRYQRRMWRWRTQVAALALFRVQIPDPNSTCMLGLST